MPNDFGAFAPVFDSPHGYLALLNLSSDDSLEAVRLVHRCAAIDPDRTPILALLSDLNWRPTLVAAVAAAFIPLDTRILDALWHRFDAGSWVVPQIAVILATIDPDFQIQARHRLEAHCPLDSSELRALTMLERHSAAGPASGAQRSAKAASALQAILSAAVPVQEMPKMLGNGSTKSARQQMKELLERMTVRTWSTERRRLLELNEAL